MIPTSCDFCGKDRKDVVKLLTSNKNAICDECVSRCHDVLIKNKNAIVISEGKYNKHTNPKEIKNFLDEYVVGQEQAKMTISVGVANHYKRLFFTSDIIIDKSNILMLGGSGTGKTHIVKTISEFLNVPIAIIDATTLTEAGYIGDDVESILSRLLQNADGDIEKAEQGIIFIDEIDKIAKRNRSSGSQSAGGEGVQAALLKIVEGSIVKVPLNGKKSQTSPFVDINTKNILFIVGGAFVGFQDIINQRNNTKKLGFGSPQASNILGDLSNVCHEDFIEFGLIPEFIGRFPVITSTQILTDHELLHVLTKTKNNLVDQYKFYFSVDGIELAFTNDALLHIAKTAQKLKTGARGLRSVIDKVLQPLVFKIPEYKTLGAKKIIVSEKIFENPNQFEMILNNEGELEYLSQKNL